jgi:hypothetical protein
MKVDGWNNVPALKIADVKKECEFEVYRENLFSEVNHLPAETKLISVKEEEGIVRLGEVSSSRPFIRYPEVINWVTEQLQQIDIPYKLRESVVENRTRSLYQEYIFDYNIETPDHEDISPMLFLRSSYVGSRPALELFTGTFRYICSNGAIVQVGNKQSIRIRAANWNDVGKVRINDQFQNVFNNFQDVSVRYIKLGSIGLTETYKRLFSGGGHLPLGLRKGVLKNLEASGAVIIHVETTRKKKPPQLAVLLHEQDLTENNINSVVEIVHDIPLWDVYNHFTNLATFESVHSTTFISKGQAIDKAFSELAA